MTLLYGMLPPVMAWQLRARRAAGGGAGGAPASPEGAPFVLGGTPVLAGMFGVATAIELSHVAADLGWRLPAGDAAGALLQGQDLLQSVALVL